MQPVLFSESSCALHAGTVLYEVVVFCVIASGLHLLGVSRVYAHLAVPAFLESASAETDAGKCHTEQILQGFGWWPFSQVSVCILLAEDVRLK